MRAAVIDIGSSSIRYLDAAFENGRICVFDKRRSTTRLAQGIDTTKRLDQGGVALSLEAIGSFVRLAEAENIKVYAYATSAVRDALDGPDFVRKIKERFGVDVDVLSGEQEAVLAHLGATNNRGALLDIGGGSFQISLGERSLSAPLGCVRARDMLQNTGVAQKSFLEQKGAVRNWIREAVQIPALGNQFLFGVGGTITTLCMLALGKTEYQPALFDGRSFLKKDLERLLEDLFEMGEGRRAHPLLSKRFDVIVPGGFVLLCTMEMMGAESIIPSDADGLEGYFLHLLNQGC